VQLGQWIEVQRPDESGAAVHGVVARIAGSLTQATRTMHLEADLPAPDGLLSGMFVDVSLVVHRPRPPVVVASRALSVTGTGASVWVVEDGHVHAHAVSIARDLGREVELTTGLSGTEVVVLSPPDDLAEGDTVDAVERSAGTPS
jgi:hypothetical protein